MPPSGWRICWPDWRIDAPAGPPLTPAPSPGSVHRLLAMSITAKLDQVVARHSELQAMLSRGDLDSSRFTQASKEYAELTPLVEAVQELRRCEVGIADAEDMLKDAASAPDMRAMAEEELTLLRERQP